MTTREEFSEMVADVVWSMARGGGAEAASCSDAVMSAWDAQAAEVERLRWEMCRERQDAYLANKRKLDDATATLRDEVERLRAEVEAARTGVPLTQENAPWAWVVEASVSARSLFFDEPVIAMRALWRLERGIWSTRDEDFCLTTEQMVELGATVLAWRK